MHFTRETMFVLDILIAFAGSFGRSLCLGDLTKLAGDSMAQTVRSILLLENHGLLKREKHGRLLLTTDPAQTTLGTILRITQPELVKVEQGNTVSIEESVFSLAVEAASANFLKIADRFTVADVIADRRAGKYLVA